MSHSSSDPLKITLTRPIRVLIMTILIISFFIISPLIILYTAGWRWNFSTGTLEVTGVLSIDTEPDDASVFLNDQLVTTKQPLRLSSLAPGNYRVKISKPGYHSFATDVTIRSHETTYIRNTTLFIDTNPQLVTSTIGTVANLKINQFEPLALQYQNSTSSPELVTINNGVVKKFSVTNKSELQCSFTKNYCLLWQKNGEAATIINTLEQTQQKINQPTNIQRIQWNDEKRGALAYAQSKAAVVELNADGKTTKLTNTSSSVWFIDTNKTMWNYSSTTLTSEQGGKPVASTGPHEVNNLIAVRSNYALLKTKSGLSVMNTIYSNPEITNFENYTNYEYHVPTAEWRLWSTWEISSLYDHNGLHTILYRAAEPIQLVKALEPAGVLLIVQNNSLIAFNPGYYTSQKLATFDSITSITTDEENRLILIAGSWNGQNGIFSLTY